MTDTLQRPDTAPSRTLSDDVIGATLVELEEDFGSEAAVSKPKVIRRFHLIDLNQMWIVVGVLTILGAILTASIVWSFNAIVGMSEWMAPVEGLKWLPAIFLDLAIIGYTLALAVFKSRGTASTRQMWLTRIGLTVSTGFSVLANSTHTIDHWKGDISSYQAIIGIVLSASIPLIALLATEVIVYMAFVDPDEEEIAARKKAKAKQKKVGARR